MSYILDALKKADAERERGAVPGLYSRPQAPAPDDDDDEPKGRTLPVVWVGAGVALCLIAVLSWQLFAREDGPAPNQMAGGPGAAPSASPLPQPIGATPAPAPLPEEGTAPPAPAHTAPDHTAPNHTAAIIPPPEPAVRAVPSASPRAADPAPVQPPPPARMAETVPSRGLGSPPAPGTQTARPAPAATAPPQGSPRVPGLAELPDDVRREIPQLTIGGAMYSEIPAQRMLIVNSQVFREGDQPYQGLVLEEIRLKSAVFKYRGYRYSVNY